MTINLKHPALVGATSALVVLAAASIVRPLPWPFWAVWVTLASVAVWRATHEH